MTWRNGLHSLNRYCVLFLGKVWVSHNKYVRALVGYDLLWIEDQSLQTHQWALTVDESVNFKMKGGCLGFFEQWICSLPFELFTRMWKFVPPADMCFVDTERIKKTKTLWVYAVPGPLLKTEVSQGFPLSQILFVMLMDYISWCSQCLVCESLNWASSFCRLCGVVGFFKVMT